MNPIDSNIIDPTLQLQYYNKLSQNRKIMAEYVWLGGMDEQQGMQSLRCKTRTLELDSGEPCIEELPVWNFDGSSTNQASSDDSEIFIKPRSIYKDPFRLGDNILVLCDCYNANDEPVETNNRVRAMSILEENEIVKDEEPWFGIEQEYTMFNIDGKPLGWPSTPRAVPLPQGPYYCSVGTENNFGRSINDAHYRACLYAGVKIAGCNAEVMLGQWEYQVGPLEGIQAGDDLWMSRYILKRVAEHFNVCISFHPKPIVSWNGAGCHTNFSTKSMRTLGGIEVIKEACEQLGNYHIEHIAGYGLFNELRLTGTHETQSINKFTYGVADRGASIRIPRQTDRDGYGYFEDRRPASNCDPYIVCSLLCESILL
jgi:glutamine synthetase